MTKWITRDTDEIGTFGEEKKRNKSNESNHNLRIFGKTKDVLPIPMFTDEDIPQKAKY